MLGHVIRQSITVRLRGFTVNKSNSTIYQCKYSKEKMPKLLQHTASAYIDPYNNMLLLIMWVPNVSEG